MLYLGVGAILYFLLATIGTASVALFVLFTGIIISFYGGGFSTVPAYLKDLFGTLEVGAIHGRLLTAWSAAGIAGPLIVNGLADIQDSNGHSGASLYTLSLFIMVGILLVGFAANLMIKPVDERFHEPRRAVEAEQADEPRFAREGEPSRAGTATATTTTRSES
jgi:MFS family permease